MCSASLQCCHNLARVACDNKRKAFDIKYIDLLTNLRILHSTRNGLDFNLLFISNLSQLISSTETTAYLLLIADCNLTFFLVDIIDFRQSSFWFYTCSPPSTLSHISRQQCGLKQSVDNIRVLCGLNVVKQCGMLCIYVECCQWRRVLLRSKSATLSMIVVGKQQNGYLKANHVCGQVLA